MADRGMLMGSPSNAIVFATDHEPLAAKMWCGWMINPAGVGVISMATSLWG